MIEIYEKILVSVCSESTGQTKRLPMNESTETRYDL